jgi:hypothetical protein
MRVALVLLAVADLLLVTELVRLRRRVSQLQEGTEGSSTGT